MYNLNKGCMSLAFFVK